MSERDTSSERHSAIWSTPHRDLPRRPQDDPYRLAGVEFHGDACRGDFILFYLFTFCPVTNNCETSASLSDWTRRCPGIVLPPGFKCAVCFDNKAAISGDHILQDLQETERNSYDMERLYLDPSLEDHYGIAESIICCVLNCSTVYDRLTSRHMTSILLEQNVMFGKT